MKKRIVVFNSGSGSGFQEMEENIHTGIIKNAQIVCLITNNPNYKCIDRAKKLGIPYEVMTAFEAEDYQAIVDKYKPDLIFLSGWLTLAKGLDPKITLNIHPGDLPRFGGKRMYGHHVHEAVITAFKKGEVTHSAVTIHFVTEIYDDGPIIFKYPVHIRDDDTPETLGARVNKIEHAWQSYIANLVLSGYISWDGKDRDSLVLPRHIVEIMSL